MSVAEAQRQLTERRLSRSEQGAIVPPEVIAEISGNHGGRLQNAIRLIEAAKGAGADAVKFQCFEPEALAAKRVGVMWQGSPMTYDQLLALYRKTHTPRAWFPYMIQRCSEIRISWFASVFSPSDVHFMEIMGCPRYKISAYEMLDGDLINAVVATGKPIIMSVRPTDRVTILEATDYEGNLTPLGLSDHSQAGISDGGRRPIVERHLMLVDVPCEDDAFSSFPVEFAGYVATIKGIE